MLVLENAYLSANIVLKVTHNRILKTQLNRSIMLIEPRHKKTFLCHMRTTKAQVSLRFICCSLPRYNYISCFYIGNFMHPASLCKLAGGFESYLIENPEDRFSRDE